MNKAMSVTTIGGRRVVSPARGRGVAPVAGGGAGMDLAASLSMLMQEAGSTLRLLSEQSTARRRIAAWEDAEITRLQEVSRVVRLHLERSHDERQAALAALVAGVQASVAAQDVDALTRILDTMVDLLKTTPLAELVSLEAVAAKLGDPGAVFTM